MTFRVRIKVCGVRLVENALAIAACGVDEIGFNFYRPSPRYVDPEMAAEIARELPPEIRRVGVFVDAPGEEIDRIAGRVGLDRLQLHGAESRDFCLARRQAVIKAFRTGPDFDQEEVAPFAGFSILVDAWDPLRPGGTGARADWPSARRLVDAGWEVYLAGGLGPGNVAEAVATVNPAVLDLNSGIESAPGVKDVAKLRALMEGLA